MLTRIFKAKGEKIEGGKLRFKITDESKDRHGTVIKMDGWDFSAFENNPTVFYQHLSMTDNPDHALGFGSLLRGADGIYMDTTLEPEDLNPLAHKISRKVDFGTLSMVSVGFNPDKWSFGDKTKGEDPDTLYFRSQELLEVSIVHIGSNRNAHNKAYIDQESIGEFVRLAKQERAEQSKQEDIEAPQPIQEETTTEIIETKEINPDVSEYFRLQLKMNTL